MAEAVKYQPPQIMPQTTVAGRFATRYVEAESSGPPGPTDGQYDIIPTWESGNSIGRGIIGVK